MLSGCRSDATVTMASNPEPSRGKITGVRVFCVEDFRTQLCYDDTVQKWCEAAWYLKLLKMLQSQSEFSLASPSV